MTISILDALARLSVAAVLSGVIGIERQVAQKAAGLRTHMLVGLGAGLFTLLGVDAFEGADPARVSAQIVAGVGFLGAGAIFRHGVSVKGLTTAAGMWTAAAVGMASGLGEYPVAIAASGVAVVVLYVVGVIQWLVRGRTSEATVELRVRLLSPDLVEQTRRAACDLIDKAGTVTIDEVGLERSVIGVFASPDTADSVITKLAALDGVVRVTRSGI